MTLHIIPESLNGYWRAPTERLSGGILADFTILAELENDSNKTIVIKDKSINISIKNSKGKLLLVEEAVYINGKDDIKISAKSRKSLKILFRIPGSLYDEIISSSESFNLEIEEASIIVSRETNSMLSLPTGNNTT